MLRPEPGCSLYEPAVRGYGRLGAREAARAWRAAAASIDAPQQVESSAAAHGRRQAAK